MNEMARAAECAATTAGVARCDIEALNREQRRMLHNRDGRYVRLDAPLPSKSAPIDHPLNTSRPTRGHQ